jgi:hypothetical protein
MAISYPIKFGYEYMALSINSTPINFTTSFKPKKKKKRERVMI